MFVRAGETVTGITRDRSPMIVASRRDTAMPMLSRCAAFVHAAGFVASIGLVGGCPTPSGGGMGVPEGGTFMHDPTCEQSGALTIDLGDGTSSFVALMEGSGPVEHFGPQGGTHSFAGVRIGGLDLERYDVVLLQIALFDAAQCGDSGPCIDHPAWGIGTWVLGDDTPFDPIDEHTIEQDQLVINAGEGSLVLQAQAEDPCGQVGLARHPFVR